MKFVLFVCGLAALLGGANAQHPEVSRAARQTPIEFLRPNPRNPRKRFDDAELDELTASIRQVSARGEASVREHARLSHPPDQR